MRGTREFWELILRSFGYAFLLVVGYALFFGSVRIGNVEIGGWVEALFK